MRPSKTCTTDIFWARGLLKPGPSSAIFTHGHRSRCAVPHKPFPPPLPVPHHPYRYAYSIASATADGGPIRYDLHKELMIQPPWDDRLSFEVRRKGRGCDEGGMRACSACRRRTPGKRHPPRRSPLQEPRTQTSCATSALAPLDTPQDGTHIYIIHFTYGNDFSEKGAFTPGKIGAWHFDKRDYVSTGAEEGRGLST